MKLEKKYKQPAKDITKNIKTRRKLDKKSITLPKVYCINFVTRFLKGNFSSSLVETHSVLLIFEKKKTGVFINC